MLKQRTPSSASATERTESTSAWGTARWLGSESHASSKAYCFEMSLRPRCWFFWSSASLMLAVGSEVRYSRFQAPNSA